MTRIVFLASLLLLGCASSIQPSSDNRVAAAFKAPNPGSLIILLPSPSKAVDIAAGEKLVLQQLYRQLSEAGYQVAALEADNYKSLWDEETHKAGELYNPQTGEFKKEAYQQVLQQFSKQIGAETQCSLILAHSLVFRTAQLNGTKAEWDGQYRNLSVSNPNRSDYRMTGNTKGLSIKLVGTTCDGKFAFKTFGGASLPFIIDIRSAQSSVRKDIFETDKEVAEGVQIALQPVLKNTKNSAQ